MLWLAIECVFDYTGAMTRTEEPTPVDLALDAFSTGLAHLVKVVEDGGLDHYDQAGLVGFVQASSRSGTRWR